MDFLSGKDTLLRLYHPLSVSQRAIYFEYLKNPASFSYNVCLSFNLTDYRDGDNAVRAAKKLFIKNPQLNARIIEKANFLFWYQDREIVNSVFFKERGDLEDIRKFREKAIDIRNEPPLQVLIFQGKSGLHITLVIHHIVCDAFSVQLLLRDFFSFLSKKDSGEIDRDPWLFSYEQLKLSQNRDFRKKCVGILERNIPRGIESPIDLPTDYPRCVTIKGKVEFMDLGSGEYHKIKDYVARKNISCQTFFRGIWELLLKDISHDPHPLYGVTTLGRNPPFLDKGIGYFMNPVVTSPTGREDSTDRYFNSQNRRGLENLSIQGYPLSFALEDLKIPRTNKYNPLFQILFNYLDGNTLGEFVPLFLPDYDVIQYEGFSLEPVYFPQQLGQFDFTFEVVESDRHIGIFFKYNRNIFSPKTIRRMMELFRDKVGIICDSDTIPVKAWNNPRIPINVVANFTMEPIIPHLEEWKRSAGKNWEITAGPYNQILQLLLDKGQIFYRGVGGVNLIFLMLQEIVKQNVVIKEVLDAINIYGEYNKRPLLIFSCDNFDNEYFTQEKLISAMTDQYSHISFFSINQFNSLYPVSNRFNPLTYEKGHIPYNDNYYAALSSFAFRQVYNILQNPLKLIAVDGDNTLWKGTLGEDGIDGIVLTEDHKKLQDKLLFWMGQGIPLCLVTKNNEDDIFELLKERGDFPIKKDDFTLIYSNWERKSQNLKAISETLNLGLDSFVFLDDNPMELAEVSSAIPQVVCIPAIKDGMHIGRFIEHLWAFDRLVVTEEDKNRVKFYKSDIQRSESAKNYTYDDFLKSLQLNVIIKSLEEDNLERAIQLSLRTNQFNMLTKRLNLKEFTAGLEKGDKYWSISAKDRFGDYGVIGLMGMTRQGAGFCLDNFMLSCRAMGKGIEDIMFKYLFDALDELNGDFLEFNVNANSKNKPAQIFFDRVMDSYPASSIRRNSLTIGRDDFKKYDLKKNLSLTDPIESMDADDEFSKDNPAVFLIQTVYSWGPGYWQKFEKSEVNRERKGIDTLLADLWKKKLELHDVPLDKSFFDAGGKSIDIPFFISEIYDCIKIKLEIIDFFMYPTISSMAEYIINKTVVPEINPESRGSQSKKKRVNDYYKRARGKVRHG